MAKISIEDYRLADVQHFVEIDSTNVEAMRQLQAGKSGSFLLLADSQTAGRGRRGRHWHSPIGGGIYMTLVRPFALQYPRLQALSLVAALGVHQALTECGARAIQLKWPNDLLVKRKKLAGILLELKQVEHLHYVLFGIGINLELPASVLNQIDQPATDLHQVIGQPFDKSALITRITGALLDNFAEFEQTAFASFCARWNSLDYYREQDIVLQMGDRQKIGKSLGVNEAGALLLQTADGIEVISGGEIFPSLHAAPPETDT